MKAWTDEKCAAMLAKYAAVWAGPDTYKLPLYDAIRAAVEEARREERSDIILLVDGLSTELLKEPHEIWLHGFNVAKKAILAILARDKEPRDAER